MISEKKDYELKARACVDENVGHVLMDLRVYKGYSGIPRFLMFCDLTFIDL